MKKQILLAADACLALACSLSSSAQDKGY